ncbi:cardiolipin synthase [Vagococcus silagei]
MMNKVMKLISNRVVIVLVLILIQLAILSDIIYRFREFFVYFYFFYIVISAIVIIKILNNRSNPAYKIAWIVPIMLIPIFGTLIYLVFGRVRFSKHEKHQMSQIQENESYFKDKTVNRIVIEDGNLDAELQSNYLSKYGEGSLFQNTTSEYYPLGEDAFAAMLVELEKAQKYIFMEYFIVEEGQMWNQILEVLERKVRQGVEVRFIYDDFGCLFTLPNDYYKELEKKGIKCRVFNPFLPVLSPIFNNRNHRKLTIIDGKVAFTGGINLADEYINEYERFGHWKDNSIKLEGEAAWGVTLIFLSLWQFVNKRIEDPMKFQPTFKRAELPVSEGYYQPYVDSPFDDETVGINVYLNLINRAKKSIYITTPYLIIDNTLMEALCTSAKSGVDIRIITPHIPDKWYVHEVTCSNYVQLIEAGVKIYEYTPGFIHSKTFVVDEIYATVGTVNLDFRSLFLHFECGVWMYQTNGVQDVLKDHLETEELSQRVTLEQAKNVVWYRLIFRSIMRIFSPLL